MVQMTWEEARGTVIEDTEIGWTLASQDRLWMVFSFDLTSNDWFFGNRLYYQSRSIRSYELWEKELLWTIRAEAEHWAEQQRLYYSMQWLREDDTVATPWAFPEVYVVNLGDDARWEKALLGDRPEFKPKFKGSIEGLRMLGEMWKRSDWLRSLGVLKDPNA